MFVWNTVAVAEKEMTNRLISGEYVNVVLNVYSRLLNVFALDSRKDKDIKNDFSRSPRYAKLCLMKNKNNYHFISETVRAVVSHCLKTVFLIQISARLRVLRHYQIL